MKPKTTNTASNNPERASYYLTPRHAPLMGQERELYSRSFQAIIERALDLYYQAKAEGKLIKPVKRGGSK